MADHGDHYTRAVAPDGSEIGELGPECGHHCGVITVGGRDHHIGHCSCDECHGKLNLILNALINGVKREVI